MKPQQAVPLLTALAPAALAVPPLAIVGAILGVGLLWLLSSEDKPQPKSKVTDTPQPQSQPVEPTRTLPSIHFSPAISRRVTREDLAEALAYGERSFTRREAVAALESLGFRKTAAYKALSPQGKFASLIEFTPDGMIGWIG